GLWAGLSNGVALIGIDSPLRRIWRGEDGVASSRSYVFHGFGDSLGVGGTSIGVYLKYVNGWKSLLNRPGTFAYTYGIRAAVTDSDGTLWICHKWPGIGHPDQGEVIRCWPNGYIEDYSAQIEGETRSVCLTGDGRACVIGSYGLYVHDGDASFDFHEIPELSASEGLILNAEHGDLHGNIWMVVGTMGFELWKYSLLSRELTNCRPGELGLPGTDIDDITSDPVGKVWFASRRGVFMFDGSEFIPFPGVVSPLSIAVGFDNTVYCGTYSDGVYVLKDEMWLSYKNPNPEIPEPYYYQFFGLPNGEGMAAYDTNPRVGGFEVLENGVWQTVAADELPDHIQGVFEGESGRWAWSQIPTKAAFHLTESGWVDSTAGVDISDSGYIMCVAEDKNGNPFLLMGTALFQLVDDAWVPIDVPAPVAPSGYKGIVFDDAGRLYLNDRGMGVAVRDTQGVWSRIDESDLLPAPPDCVGPSNEGLLYITGHDADAGEYVTIIEGDEVTLHWLSDLDLPTDEVQAIAFDLEDRAWIITRASDRSPRVLIHDPRSGTLVVIPWQSGLLPSISFSNLSLTWGRMDDRSLSKYGVLWCGPSGPRRINLAPRTEMLLEKEAYSPGETTRMDVYFANQAGSIPVDWYAACEDWDGFLAYYPSMTGVPIPAFAGLVVPTDTGLILPLDTMRAPRIPGHYKWKTGFKRAGQDGWLGLGFTTSTEFDVVAD
ncbi:MAG: hypothetical protein KAY24_15950, partial [Candidatus Eisenbacteria sp.]|nr:hypothetical protein [Candidatus Eisenbacteria bacterium]